MEKVKANIDKNHTAPFKKVDTVSSKSVVTVGLQIHNTASTLGVEVNVAIDCNVDDEKDGNGENEDDGASVDSRIKKAQESVEKSKAR